MSAAKKANTHNRDYILFFVNGKEHRAFRQDAFLPLSDFLRYNTSACGTKVVCAEGDCGACTVMVGRPSEDRIEIAYKAVNACIQYVFQLDCSSIVTVEGLSNEGQLNAVQTAMVECHGAQCGYCTPGFVVALSGLIDDCQLQKREATLRDVKESLTGNLCRCTGYGSIIKAALCASDQTARQPEQTFNEKFPPQKMLEVFEDHKNQTVLIDGKFLDKDSKFFKPTTLQEAVAFKNASEDTTVVSGGTDVCVNINKRGFSPPSIMSLSGLAGLAEIEIEQNTLIVGAKVTLHQLEKIIQEKIPQFYKILWTFGSPQIRRVGTLAGNIANGSPIADTLPFLYVMNARIELTGLNSSRELPLSSFYLGYKKFDLKRDELITRIFIPLLNLSSSESLLRLYKISKREHLDISSVAAAFYVQTGLIHETKIMSGSSNLDGLSDLRRPVRIIEDVRIALGGVAATCVYAPEAQTFLQGKEFIKASFIEAGRIAAGALTPLSDVRGSREFRTQLVENLFLKFFYECANEQELEAEALCLT